MAQPYFRIEDIHVGWRRSWRRTISEADVRAMVELSGDQGGYHVDEAFARAAGFRGLIAPGLLQASMLTKLGGELNFLAREMNLRFHRPVHAGDTLDAVCEVVKIEPERRLLSIRGEITNQHGETVLTADVQGHLPDPAWGVPDKPAPPGFEC